jgi:hypothetical protein
MDAEYNILDSNQELKFKTLINVKKSQYLGYTNKQ